MDVYLKFEGPDIKGESMDKKHEGWIEIDAWSWNLNMPLTEASSSGGARTSRQVEKEPLTVQKTMDLTSAELFEMMCKGKHFKKAVLEVCRAVGDGDGGHKAVVCRYEMENVIIAQLSTDGGDDAPNETLQIDPGSVKFDYTGLSPETGKKTGKKGHAGWNFLKNETI